MGDFGNRFRSWFQGSDLEIDSNKAFKEHDSENLILVTGSWILIRDDRILGTMDLFWLWLNL